MKAMKDYITIDKLKEAYLNKELESGIYSSIDEDGNNIMIFIQQGKGFDIHTNQKNGWVRVDSFDYDETDGSWERGESYAGKWKDN